LTKNLNIVAHGTSVSNNLLLPVSVIVNSAKHICFIHKFSNPVINTIQSKPSFSQAEGRCAKSFQHFLSSAF